MFKEKDLLTMNTLQLEGYLRRTKPTDGNQPTYETIRARVQVSKELSRRAVASPLAFSKGYL